MLGIPLPYHACDAAFVLDPGETLVAVTDGVGDSRAPGSDRFFGAAGTALAVAGSLRRGNDPATAVLDAAAAHRGARLGDDTGAAILRLQPFPASLKGRTHALDHHRRSVRPVALGLRHPHRRIADPPALGDRRRSRDLQPHRRPRRPALAAIRTIACAAAALLLAALPAASQAQTAPSPSTWVAFEQTWAGVTAYSATVAIFERDDAQVQSSVLDYTFRKPANATVHFVAGKNAGVTVAWDGGATVVAHRGSGLMALIKKTFALHDPLVTTIRGSSIDQLSFAAFIAHSQGTPGIVSQEPGPTILDIPTEAVTLVPTTSATDTGLTREVIDLSVPTNLPIRVLGYENDTLVREIDFSNVQLQTH
jgi:outer membrane lipoprotein-sorting protein